MIKRLTSEEFDNLHLHRRGRSSVFYNTLLEMKVGEAIIIEKKEWRPKYPPTTIINRVQKNFGYKFTWGALSDRSGWAVKRIK